MCKWSIAKALIILLPIAACSSTQPEIIKYNSIYPDLPPMTPPQDSNLDGIKFILPNKDDRAVFVGLDLKNYQKLSANLLKLKVREQSWQQILNQVNSEREQWRVQNAASSPAK